MGLPLPLHETGPDLIEFSYPSGRAPNPVQLGLRAQSTFAELVRAQHFLLGKLLLATPLLSSSSPPCLLFTPAFPCLSFLPWHKLSRRDLVYHFQGRRLFQWGDLKCGSHWLCMKSFFEVGWQLHHEVFKATTRRWRTLWVDLFAFRDNHQSF